MKLFGFEEVICLVFNSQISKECPQNSTILLYHQLFLLCMYYINCKNLRKQNKAMEKQLFHREKKLVKATTILLYCSYF